MSSTSGMPKAVIPRSTRRGRSYQPSIDRVRGRSGLPERFCFFWKVALWLAGDPDGFKSQSAADLDRISWCFGLFFESGLSPKRVFHLSLGKNRRPLSGYFWEISDEQS